MRGVACISTPTQVIITGAHGSSCCTNSYCYPASQLVPIPTGTITITAPLGATLTYSIDGTTYQASPTFNLVAPGTYNVTVQDGGTCTSGATQVILNTPAAPAAPTASATTQPTCAVPTGTHRLSLHRSRSSTDLLLLTWHYLQRLQPTFNLVTPGTYNVTVQDGGVACTSTATQVIITGAPGAPAAPTATATLQPTCAVPTGTITITAPLGATLTYSIDGTTYPGFTNILILVAPGTYNVTVQDGGTCTSGATQVVLNTPAAPAAPTAYYCPAAACAIPTGTITVTAPTGAGLTYSIDGTTYTNTTGTFTLVAPGTYDVTVKNAGGCISAATQVIVNDSTNANHTPTFTQITPVCQNSNCSTVADNFW